MALLFEEDYAALLQRGLSYEESEQLRYFVFVNYPLPVGVYNVGSCHVLVSIPANYNQAGNDMFWTFPRLSRLDGKSIPNIESVGSNQNLFYNGNEYCRWSRHWFEKTPGEWRPGRDNIISIQRRIEWAFENPDT